MSSSIINLKEPTQCHLWQKENISTDDMAFETVQTYDCDDDDHLKRKLLKCKQCGQLYFYEFYEVIDYEKGNDPQYRTFIPVDSEIIAKEMSKKSPIDILYYYPRIQSDFPEDAKKRTTKWNKI